MRIPSVHDSPPRSLVLRGALLTGLFYVSSALGQEATPPYPGAAPLVADEEFQRFQALEVATSAGVLTDSAAPGFSLSSFVTAAPVDSVTAHLAVGAVETYQEKTAEPDSLIPPFLASLTSNRLDDLARAVGSELSGFAYRDAVLAALKNGVGSIDYRFVAHEHEDGSLTYYEVHRPYLDLGKLQWVDASRIRVIRLLFGNF